MTGPASQKPESDLLANAVAAARAGDMNAARGFAERGLREGGGDPVAFHAFLGMVCARTGDRDAAATHLKSAHDARPGDVTIACNLIAMLMEAGRDEEALAVATQERAKSDPSRRVARYRGFLAQKAEDFGAAVEAYELVLQDFPQDFECLNNLGNARSGVGDHEGAVEALKRALEIDPRAAPTYLNLASALTAVERNDEAEAVLKKAMAAFPADSRPPYQLYVLYKTTFQQEEALDALETAVARDPDIANMQLKLAIEYGLVRRSEEAERAFFRVIELDPGERDAYLGLAIQYEYTNREEEFAPLIDLARGKGIEDGALAFIEALELSRTKRFGEALERLAAVPEDVERVRAAHLRATLLDRLMRPDEAFASYAEANNLMAENPSDPLARGEKLRADVRAEIDLLTPDWVASWPEIEVDDGRDDPVFLVGFPRSGTTLLDTILMGHPETVVMEEQPALNYVADALGGLDALAGLDADGVAKARAHYFEEVAKVQSVPPGKMLIDKSPLFLYRAPLIRRLFPRAKIILALRHPCDVALSCFMSNFRLNSAMSNFLRIEDTADFYDVCFTHWKKSRALLPLDVHEIVYERLIEDVAGEVSPLLQWLGLEEHEGMLDHSKTAKSRGLITTASYSQVTEPIYKRAAGRWLRYRKHLEPVIDTLAPWAEEFGYGDPRKAAAEA